MLRFYFFTTFKEKCNPIHSLNQELERILKMTNIQLSVDKVLAGTVTTIQIKLPKNKDILTKTMIMPRHQKIAKLFDESFWGTH